MILPSSHRIRPIVSACSSRPVSHLEVWQKPKVAFSQRLEIIEPTEDRRGEIIESNARMFEAMGRKRG
jgi:molybdopterin biosynthesis enzyme